MFTGLIEEIGTIEQIHNIGLGRKIRIKSSKINDDLKIDDSVSIDGVCQTVVEYGQNFFVVEAVEETMSKTNFKLFRPGLKVNLERAAKLNSRLGGHIVQGHCDTTGKIISIEKQTLSNMLTVEFPFEYRKYVVAHGSIAINGISLTVARLNDTNLTVAVIPHTWKSTTLNEKTNGDLINLEFDILSKYIENIIKYNNSTEKNQSNLDYLIDQPDF